MNRVYKVIWSKVKHCYVVASELGLRMEATKTNPWKVDISIYGYGGKHRGFGGNVGVAYRF